MDTCKSLTATALVAALSIPIITHSALVDRLALTVSESVYQASANSKRDD